MKIHFRVSSVLFTGLLAFALLGPLGCSGGGGTTCKDDTQCTGGQKCNVTTGKCEGGTTGACTTNTDCGDKKVCDGGKCYSDCTVDGFAGCDPGNTCDTTTSKRCKCDATKCAAVGNSGCHPVSDTCDNYCNPANTTDCSGEEKCIPTAADPTKGFCQKPVSCTSDANCASDTRYPKCDTAKGFCVAEAKCTADADCASNATGKKCNTTTGKCVACLADADCDTTKRETCDTTTNTCKSATGCAKSKECYDATPRTYCGTPGSACSAAPERTCANMVDSEKGKNSGWEGDAQGSVVWDLKEVERKTTNNCVTGGSQDSCTDDSDCSGGEVCAFDKKCREKMSKGEVVMTFKFYAPRGLKSGYLKGSGNYMSGTSEKADFGWTDMAAKLEITSGDKNEGVAQFSVCESKGPYKGWFIFNDEGDKPSNAACVDVSARQ